MVYLAHFIYVCLCFVTSRMEIISAVFITFLFMRQIRYSHLENFFKVYIFLFIRQSSRPLSYYSRSLLYHIFCRKCIHTRLWWDDKSWTWPLYMSGDQSKGLDYLLLCANGGRIRRWYWTISNRNGMFLWSDFKFHTARKFCCFRFFVYICTVTFT